MDFSPDPELEQIRVEAEKLASAFDDEYWSRCDEAHEFPWEYYNAFAKASGQERPEQVELNDVARGGLPPAGGGQEFTVSSALYRMTFSTNGAEVVSVRLFEYETDGEPVELIASREELVGGALSLRLVGEDRSLHLGNVRFEPYFAGGSQTIAAGTDIRLSTGEKTILFRATSVVSADAFASDVGSTCRAWAVSAFGLRI